MNKLFFVALITVSFLAKATAQQLTERTIRKVSAKEIKAIIDNSTEPMIVNFWATWCGPCIREISWFDSIIAERKAPVKLLLVSLDFKTDYPSKLTAFVKKQGYKGEVVYLQDSNLKSYISIIEPKWKGAIPASIFVNNTTKYYQVFNEQIPKQRFGFELDKLGK